mgnify:CR=1 FL=1
MADAGEGGFKIEEDHRCRGTLGGEAEGAVLDVHDVGVHRAPRDEAALRVANPVTEDGLQLYPEGAGNESVVRVHD